MAVAISYAFDTNIYIYLINGGEASARILNRLNQLQGEPVILSAIVVAELRYGAEKSKRREKNLAALERFLADFDIEPFDERATRQYGVIRSVLESTGRTIGPLDTLIAAHAVSLDAILVTNNTSEFQRVPGLKVENWLS
jgi:tRNA(fMet)-specific endonuclease VapC